jgi:hypothetical protein
MNTNARGAKTTTTAASTDRPVTWNVDDVPSRRLAGVYINESGYKDVVAARPARRCLDWNIRH